MIDKTLYVQRIATASNTELLAINYELALAYIGDARSGDNQGIIDARRCVNLLMKSLDMQYEISQLLFALYTYVDRQLASALFSKEKRSEILDECTDILTRLMKSFKSIQKDGGEAVMQNAQQIYAGLTYSGSTLGEYIPDDNKRGYKA